MRFDVVNEYRHLTNLYRLYRLCNRRGSIRRSCMHYYGDSVLVKYNLRVLSGTGQLYEPSRSMTSHTIRLEEVIVNSDGSSHCYTGCSGLLTYRRRQGLLLSIETPQTVRIQFFKCCCQNHPKLYRYQVGHYH